MYGGLGAAVGDAMCQAGACVTERLKESGMADRVVWGGLKGIRNNSKVKT